MKKNARLLNGDVLVFILYDARNGAVAVLYRVVCTRVEYCSYLVIIIVVIVNVRNTSKRCNNMLKKQIN